MSGDNDTRMKTWVQKWLNEFCVGAANGINAKNSPARTAQNANFASHTQQLNAQQHTLQQAQELAQRDKNHTQSLANKRAGWRDKISQAEQRQQTAEQAIASHTQQLNAQHHTLQQAIADKGEYQALAAQRAGWRDKISQAEQRQQTAEQAIAILQAEALPTRWGVASALVPLVASLLFFQILNLFSIQVLRKAHPAASRTAATKPMPQNATRLLPQAAKMPQNSTSPLPQSAKMPQSRCHKLTQSRCHKLPQNATRLLPQAAKMPQNATRLLPQSAKRPQNATRLLPQAAKMPQSATRLLPQAAKMPQSATSLLPQAAKMPQTATRQQPAPKMLNRSVALWLRNRCHRGCQNATNCHKAAASAKDAKPQCCTVVA